MNKFLIPIFFMTLTIQVLMFRAISSETNEITNQNSQTPQITQTKRYQLFENVFRSLNNIVWSQQTYQEIILYLDDLKHWTFINQEIFSKLNTYDDLRASINTSLNLLNELRSNTDNCEKQMKFKMEQHKLKMFQSPLLADEDGERILREWMQKDRILLRKLLFLTIRPYKDFFVKLQAAVELYINSLDDNEEEKLRNWLGKFTQETDFVEKLLLINDFMGLFYEEKYAIESKCL